MKLFGSRSHRAGAHSRAGKGKTTPSAAGVAGGEAAEAAQGAYSPRPLRRIAVGIVAVFVVWHVAATYVWAAPEETPLRELFPGDSLTAYNEPFFDQYWGVFAPNPIGANYELSIRASMEEDGEFTENTEWVNATATESKIVEHNPLASRAAYAAYKAGSKLKMAYDDLSDEDKAVVAESYFSGDDWWQRLKEDLAASGETPSADLRRFHFAEWRVISYATQVARAVWGDGVGAVQYHITTERIEPFDERGNDDWERGVRTVDAGWRGLVDRAGQDDERFAEVFNGLGPVKIEEKE